VLFLHVGSGRYALMFRPSSSSGRRDAKQVAIGFDQHPALTSDGFWVDEKRCFVVDDPDAFLISSSKPNG